MKRLIALFLIAGVLLSMGGCCLSHQWVDATCTAPQTCAKCGQTEGEALPHTYADATCTSPKTCTVCAATEGDPLPHQWSEASCTAPKTCEVCALTEGDVLPHSYAEATCSAPKTCSVCGATEGEALGHSVDQWAVAKETSCAEAGSQNGTCSVCGSVIEQEIPALDHTPGEWEVTKKATKDAKGERSILCTVCGAVLQSEQYEMTPEEIEAEYKAACQKYTYDEIARNPGAYEGKQAVFTGEVIQVQQESFLGLMIYVMRVNVTKGYYYKDTVYVTYYASEDDPRILEDDIIVMYGELTGEKTYTTVMGASVTIPSFTAQYIEFK